MTDGIQTQQNGATLEITLYRPERRNALTHAMYGGLRQALEAAAANPAVRCVIITGQEDCFTAGNDLEEFAEGLPGAFAETPVGRFLLALVEFPKPLVAAVNGSAVGIGTTMLLHCDLVYAGGNARFQLPFVNLGLVPEGASSLLLPLWLGRARANELLLLGEPFDAARALELGLVNRMVAPERTLPTARSAAERLCQQPPAAIRASKQLIRTGMDSITETLKREGERFAEHLGSPEAAEAFAAFREKRKPDFSGFD